MKIVYIVRSLVQKAGAERILIDKMNYLAQKKEYEIYLITYEQSNHPLAYPLSDRVKQIHINTPFYTLYQYTIPKRVWQFLAMRIRFYQELKKHITRIQPDITIGTTLSYTLIGSIIGLKDGSRKIIETHSERSTLKQRSGAEKNKLFHFLFKQYDARVARQIGQADALVTLTSADAAQWADVKKAVVIPNILTHYPEQTAYSTESRSIISAGRLEPQKGYDMLIDAWKRITGQHPDWTLHIYGEGSQEGMLREKLKEYDLETTCLIHPPTSQIYNKYMESSFYVLSSRYEGFGLVLSEAMSCSLPCVAFDCPCGPSDIIKNDEDGLLVEKENIEQLVSKMDYLIAHPQQRKAMGERARVNIRRYMPEVIMPQWETLFESLTQNDKHRNK